MNSILPGLILLCLELFQPFPPSMGVEIARVPCGDLLKEYATRPDYLEFVGCEEGEGQLVVRAEYRVMGRDAQSVERYLVENYEMGPLKWICCGWENQGKNGSFTHEAITKVNPFYRVSISMFASGEMEDEKGDISLEFDRNQIPYFTVWVSIVEV